MNLTDVIAVTTAKLANNSVTSAKIVDGTIVNADISSAAGISGTKISPNFGSQNIQTSGLLNIISDVGAGGIFSASGATANALIQFRKSQGTHESPQIVQNGDSAGALAFFGYDGNENNLSGGIATVVRGTPTAGKVPISMNFQTRNDANNYASRIFVDENGNVGINTLTPSSKFHVAGDVSVSSTTTATTVGAAGAAGALPAQPVGYLVVNINGTARKIPYYNV